jgi:hypothetical protein
MYLKAAVTYIISLIFFCELEAQQTEYYTLLSPSDSLQIVRKPTVMDFSRAGRNLVLSELPEYDENNNKGWQVDLRSRDLTNLDLSDRLNDLVFADFDSQTKWPESLPNTFDPDKIMELGMDPGLNVRELHKTGITGEKVGIAIIDLALLVDHIEYKDQLKSYEEIHWISGNSMAEMHGPMVASIAVGKNLGVAPDADLYFIACRMGTWNTDGKFKHDLGYVAEAIERIININRTLPADRKIRVISISLQLMSRIDNYDMAMKAIQKAKEENIVTLSVDSHPFFGMGREPLDDPNLVSSYSAGQFWKNRDNIDGSRLLVPMDSRSTASPTGDSDYVFYRSGGLSMTVPYLAGLYALACQCDPDIRFSEFWNLLDKTSVPIEQNGIIIGKVVNPLCIKELEVDR